MKKTVIHPGMWGEVESDVIDELQMAHGVVTHRQGYKKVIFSGAGHPEGNIEEQTRTVFEHLAEDLNDLGGEMSDVTKVRLYVRDELLTQEMQLRIHEVRSEFFSRPHYPAATMIGIDSFVHEDILIEIEIEAEIPEDNWETEVIPFEPE